LSVGGIFSQRKIFGAKPKIIAAADKIRPGGNKYGLLPACQRHTLLDPLFQKFQSNHRDRQGVPSVPIPSNARRVLEANGGTFPELFYGSLHHPINTIHNGGFERLYPISIGLLN
jgi:hypothetical protein